MTECDLPGVGEGGGTYVGTSAIKVDIILPFWHKTDASRIRLSGCSIGVLQLVAMGKYY